MEKKIDILIFSGEHRRLGMDIKEVNKINSVSLQSREDFSRTDNFCTLNTFFPEEGQEYQSILYLDSLILGVPGEIEIISISLTDILLLPPYLQNKQQPFFCWGFIKRNNALIMLVTLSKYVKEK